MSHIAHTSAALIAAAVLVGACGGSDEAARLTAEKAAADSAAAAAASAPRRVSGVMIGSRIDSLGRVIEPTFQFSPQETVYVSVGTTGNTGSGNLTAAWRYQTGEILQQSSEAVRPAGQNTAFQLTKPKGLKPGTYKVVLFLGGDSADTKAFVVKK
jgi:hypothetical protein